MPDVPMPDILLLIPGAIAGLILGWLARGKRARREKLAVGAGWTGQLEAWRSEQDRLVAQNKGLMEQVNQWQASHKDASNRSRELSSALKEAFQRRDELQRQIKDIRSNLEGVLAQRRRLESDMRDLTASDNSLSTAVREKDEKIFRLSRELESWQSRLPPLIQRFKDRDHDARQLESALDRANERIFELESGRAARHTHVESVGRDDLQAIKGVGPAIEKTLHNLGIFSYRQIAELSEYDIDRVAMHLKGFRSRIYREDWIGQARELEFVQARQRHQPGMGPNAA